MQAKFAVAVAELHIPGARSLKEKRSVVRRLVDRIHRRYRVSIAETGYHDKHQRTEIGIAIVHSDSAELDRILGSIERLLADIPDTALLHWHADHLESAP